MTDAMLPADEFLVMTLTATRARILRDVRKARAWYVNHGTESTLQYIRDLYLLLTEAELQLADVQHRMANADV